MCRLVLIRYLKKRLVLNHHWLQERHLISAGMNFGKPPRLLSWQHHRVNNLSLKQLVKVLTRRLQNFVVFVPSELVRRGQLAERHQHFGLARLAKVEERLPIRVLFLAHQNRQRRLCKLGLVQDRVIPLFSRGIPNQKVRSRRSFLVYIQFMISLRRLLITLAHSLLTHAILK